MSYRLRPMFLVASLLLAGSGNLGMADSPISCADTEVLGRVVEASYTELPQTTGTINLGVLWALRVKVVRVIRGRVLDRAITVSVVSDPAIARGIDIDFQLKRISAGYYQWKQAEADCRN